MFGAFTEACLYALVIETVCVPSRRSCLLSGIGGYIFCLINFVSMSQIM